MKWTLFVWVFLLTACSTSRIKFVKVGHLDKKEAVSASINSNAYHVEAIHPNVSKEETNAIPMSGIIESPEVIERSNSFSKPLLIAPLNEPTPLSLKTRVIQPNQPKELKAPEEEMNKSSLFGFGAFILALLLIVVAILMIDTPILIVALAFFLLALLLCVLALTKFKHQKRYKALAKVTLWAMIIIPTLTLIVLVITYNK